MSQHQLGGWSIANRASRHLHPAGGRRGGPHRIEALERRVMLDATLVRDINPGAGDSLPSSLANGGGTLYFQANDASTGAELWTADRAGTGAVLLKDINPGGNSFPTGFTRVGDTTFFVADDGTHGQELWKTDGTAGGTLMVSDIEPGSGSSFPSSLVNVNGTLFFAAGNVATGDEIWKSDGTAGGTVLISDIVPGNGGSSCADLVSFNGLCYFSATTPTIRRELWSTDGVSVTLVKDCFPGVQGNGLGNNGAVGDITVAGNQLFFHAITAETGSELWASDGTTVGTRLVRDIAPGPQDGFPFNFAAVGTNVFFSADDGVTGTELWKSDGTTGGTTIVRDINPGSASSSPSDPTNVGGILFFAAVDGANGEELWRADIDGLGNAGASLVRDLNSGGTSGPDNLTNVNGALFFAANDGINGDELWISDGTSVGTVLIADISSAAGGSQPGELTNVSGTLFFAATDPTNGRELWSLVRGLSAGFPIRVAGADAGGQALVYVYQSQTTSGPGQIVQTIQPYGSFTGGVRVATGDIDGDGLVDVVTAAGPGAGPHVRVFNAASGAPVSGPLASFFAYDPAFAGGVFVATGDVNGDGRADIITGAGTVPHVEVFSGVDGSLIRSFFAYDPAFQGGAHVSAGDVTGDGSDDIVTGAGDAAPHVKVFDGSTSALLASFFAYDPGFQGGVYVAAGDISGDGIADIVTGTAVGPPHVKVFSGNGFGVIQSFFAYDPGFQGGVRVAAGADLNVDGTDDIFTSAGFGGFQNLKAFSGGSAGLLESFLAPDTGNNGGMFVAIAR